MKYDLSIPSDCKDFKNDVSKHLESRCIVELKKKREARTIDQNSYLHVLLGVLALEFGYTIEEVKQVFKKKRKDLFTYKKNGYTFTRGTSGLNTFECSQFTDWLIEWANVNYGIRLMTPEEYKENRRAIDRDIEMNEKYLKG